MIQRALEKTAERYSMLPNAVKREKLASIKKWENLLSALSLLLVIGTRRSSHGAMQSLLMALSFSGIRIEYLLFPLLLLVEVAFARTAKNSVALVTLLFTSIMAAAVTYGYLFYYIIYSAVFIYAEIKLMAMKSLKDYPIFEDEKPQPPKPDLADEVFSQRYERRYAAAEDTESTQSVKAAADTQPDELSADGLDIDGYFSKPHSFSGGSDTVAAESMDAIALPASFRTEDSYDSEND